MRAFCLYDQLSFCMAALYLMLLLTTCRQITLHWETFQEARAISLRIYLYLTMLFASLRFIDFLLTPILVPCQMKEWQWDVLGDNQGILVVILATLPAVLFFTSYSSFAYSTARVYDSLTHSSWTQTTRGTLLGLNACVYFTLVLFWTVHAVRVKASSPFDRIAQVTLSCAALITSTGFLMSGIFTLRYYRHEANSTRAEQVERVMKMSRIVVVTVICTVCFALRAVILLLKLKLAGAEMIVYFLVAEIIPTISMLYTFSPKGRSGVPLYSFFGLSGGTPREEYRPLKQDHPSSYIADESESDSEQPA